MGSITSVRTRPIWRDGPTPLWQEEEARDRHFATPIPGVDYWEPLPEYVEAQLSVLRIRHYQREVKNRDPGPYWYRTERKIHEYHIPLFNPKLIEVQQTSTDQPVWWDQIGG